MWGFPRNRGIFGDPYNEDYRILQSFLRSPVLRKIDFKCATIHVGLVFGFCAKVHY